jgi:hypothetical protein
VKCQPPAVERQPDRALESILICANVHCRTETDALQARVTVAELIRAQLRRRDTIPRSRSNSND